MINDTWADGKFGKVIVMAKRGQSKGDLGPLLKRTVRLSNGTTVECVRFRATIWGNFDEFEPLDMRCKSELDLATVVSVDITYGTGSASR